MKDYAEKEYLERLMVPFERWTLRDTIWSCLAGLVLAWMFAQAIL